jgi:hypothetical protein
MNSVRARTWLSLLVLGALLLSLGVLWLEAREERAGRLRAESELQALRASIEAQARRPLGAGPFAPAALREQPALLAATTTAAADAARAQAQSADAAPRTQPFDSTDFARAMREQLTDPEARSRLRSRQRMGIVQMYRDLLQRWNLSAEETDRVIDALAEAQLRQMERAMLANIEGAPPTRSPLDPGADGYGEDDALSALLSAEQRRQLEQYRRTLGDRLSLGPLFNELELARMPLSAERRERLIEIVHEERAAVAPPQFRGDPADADNMRREIETWESDLSQRVRDRIDGLLTGEQLERYEEFEQRRREERTAMTSGGTIVTGGMFVGAPVASGGAGDVAFSVATPVSSPAETKAPR